MTRPAVFRLRPPNPRYDTALAILDAMAALAADARADGWEVNVAIETGGPERITFSAQRPIPQTPVAE